MITAQDIKILPFSWDDTLVSTAMGLQRTVVSCYGVPYPAVVAGRGSDLNREIDIDAVSRDTLPVLRRQGGGGAVFLDTGCVILSAVYPEQGFADIPAQFDRCIQWLIQGLLAIGITGVYKDGISDLVVDDHKVGGTCLKRSKDFVYFSAVLLVSCNLDLMDTYLCHPPREPDYRNGRSHGDFVKNLNTVAGWITADKIVNSLNYFLDPDVDPGR